MRPLALSSRPPPLCGNREFRADVPHRNRDHRAFGAVRLVHSSIFPTTSRTQEGRFSAERDWSSCNRRWSWAARAGALGGARCETNGRPRAQYAPEPSVPEPPVPYLAARSSRSSSRWPQLIAPSLPAFSVNRESLSSRRTRIPPLLSLHATSPQNYGRRRSTTCGGEFPAGSSPDCRLPDLL